MPASSFRERGPLELGCSCGRAAVSREIVGGRREKGLFSKRVETRIVDEKIYGVPFDVVPLAMFYSLKAFEEAGLSESDVPKTWDQFLEIAHKLTKGDRFGCLFQTAPGIYQNLTWYPFMWQGGGDIATPDGKHSAFASPATVQALKFWQDTILQHVAPRNVLGKRPAAASKRNSLRVFMKFTKNLN